MKSYKVLSLFDGISVGRLALQRASIPVSQYFASEIDKHAITVSKNNWPEIIQIGDVRQVNGADYSNVDLLIGGSACQSFSNAGKREGFDGKSGIFWEFVRVLKECKPRFFLLENVVMKKEWAAIISEALGVEYVEINSSLVSAQHRRRYYWFGQIKDGVTTQIPIPQPEDKKIMLTDVIDQDYDGIWVWPRGANPGGVQNYKGKSPSVTTSSWQHNFYIYRDHGKEPVFSKSGLKELGYINSNYKTNRVYSSEGKCPCLNAASGGVSGPGNALIMVKDKVRKFTIEEAETLQTLPHGYTKGISLTQRFKCLGNGWTCDVIAHILKQLPNV